MRRGVRCPVCTEVIPAKRVDAGVWRVVSHDRTAILHRDGPASRVTCTGSGVRLEIDPQPRATSSSGAR